VMPDAEQATFVDGQLERQTTLDEEADDDA
jgi:hypothetical protein